MFHHNSCNVRSYSSSSLDSGRQHHINSHLPQFYGKGALASSPMIPCSTCICASRSTHFCSLPNYQTLTGSPRSPLFSYNAPTFGNGRYCALPYTAMENMVRDYRNVSTFRGRRERTRRPRTIFKPTQLKGLESYFQKSQYIDRKERTKLADTLHLTDRQIKVWYQNRRAKNRRTTSDNTNKDNYDEDKKIEIDIESSESNDCTDYLEQNDDEVFRLKQASFSESKRVNLSPRFVCKQSDQEKESVVNLHQNSLPGNSSTWRQISHSFPNVDSNQSNQSIKKKGFFSIQSLLQK